MKTLSLILVTLLMTPPGLSAALTRIGAAAAVSGRVMATAPKAKAGRIMSSGKTVWHMDKISTGAKGRLQIMLLDQTVFTIGPKTELILDEFVYDPFTNTGKISARITKGVFRFVTGKIARKQPSRMKVKLPVGTIGIRGTIAAGAILPDGTEMIALLGPGPKNAAGERPGAISVTSEGVTRSITSPGFGVIVKKGAGVSKVMKFSKEQLAKLDVAPPAESDKGGSDPTGGKSAKEESGEGDDSAQGDLTETKSTGNTASSFSDLTDDAASDIATGVADGITQFADLRAISGGMAFFDGQGSYVCSGSCGSGTNIWTLHMNVDFDNKTIGGASPQVSHIAIELGGEIGFSTSDIPIISFSSLSGDATFTFGSPGTNYFAGSNTDFDGSAFSFHNVSGVTGAEIRGNLQYSDGSSTASGSITSPCTLGCP